MTVVPQARRQPGVMSVPVNNLLNEPANKPLLRRIPREVWKSCQLWATSPRQVVDT